jgi:hypothetical protein
MACRKCGSAWTTIHGADRASCPECCKSSRFWARQRGLIDADSPQQKECKHCGKSFQATTPSEKAKSKYCSDECRKKARSLWQIEYRRAVSAGDRASKTMEGRVISACLACGNKLGKGQKKYCCNACFVKARSDGIQEWDRSAIDEAARNRPNNFSQSPWRYFHKQCGSEMRGFLRTASLLWKQARTPKDCLQCGRLFYLDGRFCSGRCANRAVLASSCVDCGHGVSHSWRVRTPRCRKCLNRRNNKSNRKRCRKYGVRYDSKLKPKVIFQRDDYKCYLCGRQTRPDKPPRHPRYPTVDHVVPLSAGIYGHVDHNVRCACNECNTRKGTEWDRQLVLIT